MLWQVESTAYPVLVIKFKSRGFRFDYSINDGKPTLSKYGEEIRIPIGSNIRLVSRGTLLSFTALPSPITECGFHIRVTEDHRSGGKARLEKEGCVLFRERLRNKRLVVPDKWSKSGVAITAASIDDVTAMMTNTVVDGISSSHGPDLK